MTSSTVWGWLKTLKNTVKCAAPGVALDWSLGNDCRSNFGRYALDAALEVLVKERCPKELVHIGDLTAKKYEYHHQQRWFIHQPWWYIHRKLWFVHQQWWFVHQQLEFHEWTVDLDGCGLELATKKPSTSVMFTYVCLLFVTLTKHMGIFHQPDSELT